MRLTDRDEQIIRFVIMYGCLTTAQIANLFCMGIKNTQRRLRKLVQAGGYLRRVSLPVLSKGGNPSLFYLGEQGSQLTNTPSYKPRLTLGLSHQLKNTDLLIQIILSFRNSPVVECHVMPEHLIKIAGQEIIPDGAFLLKKQNKSALFFIENDSGTEVAQSPTFNQDIDAKFSGYVEMFRQNNNIQLYNDFFDCELNRFRVLFITSSPRRLTSIYSIASDKDPYGFIWLTTMTEFKRRGIAANIFQVPGLSKSNLSII